MEHFLLDLKNRELEEIPKLKRVKLFLKEMWYFLNHQKNLKNLLTKKKMNKITGSYKTISEVVKILGLKSKKDESLPTHTIRFWEKKFKQIKPKIFNNNRRYYDQKNIELLKKIHFLLKEQGMTINGAKKILNNNEPLKLDETSNNSIKTDNLKNKLVKISNLVKILKKIK